MAKRRLDLSQPVDVPVSKSGTPTVQNGFVRAAQDTSETRFRSTGAALRERFRILMQEARDKASGLPSRDRTNLLDRPLDTNLGGVVTGRIDPSRIGSGKIYQWSERTPNSNLNAVLKQHLKDSNYVAKKAATGHYGRLAQQEITYKNGYAVLSDLGKHYLDVHNGNHQAEENRLSGLIDQNHPQTILEHASAAGVQVLHDSTSIGSHRTRVYVAPGLIEKGERKVFTNDASTPITARQDVDALPKAARYRKA